jgi:hypothetical protein
MRRALVLCVLLVIVPRSLWADPISAGIWSMTPAPAGHGFPFYDGPSFDCDQCGVAFWLPAGIEYLNDGDGGPVGFTFSKFSGATLSFRHTSWMDGTLSWDPDSGDFVYDTGTGYSHRSAVGMAMALFRNRGSVGIDYWLAIEDLPSSWPIQDRDFNDAVYSWTERLPTGQPDPPPAPTPEPGTLLLLSAGVMTIAGLRKASRV